MNNDRDFPIMHTEPYLPQQARHVVVQMQLHGVSEGECKRRRGKGWAGNERSLPGRRALCVASRACDLQATVDGMGPAPCARGEGTQLATGNEQHARH
jgi:hypothetical protein